MRTFFIVLAFALGGATFLTVTHWPETWEVSLIASVMLYGIAEWIDKEYRYGYPMPLAVIVSVYVSGGISFLILNSAPELVAVVVIGDAIIYAVLEQVVLPWIEGYSLD